MLLHPFQHQQPKLQRGFARNLKGFEREVASYGGLWCCNRPPGGKGAGHIWYDFLADVVPHRDRHNRNFEGEWKPIMGP